jgi:PAS domain S-box-containing protein
MIWTSVPLMTALDLVIIVITGATLWSFFQIRSRRPLLTQTGPLLIISGLLCITLFYLTDLATMHALPLFMPMAEAMAIMDSLHQHYSWLIILLAISLIGIGLRADIIERKREEETLKESESLFRTTIDHLPLGLNVKDTDGRYLLVNDTMADRYGLRKEDLIGKTNEELFPEAKESNEASRAQEIELIKTKKVTQRVQEKEFQDGTLHTLLIDKFPIFDDEGNLVSIGITGVDITEQKEAEESLRKSEERFRILVEHAPEAITMLDVDTGLYVDANPMAETLHGLPRDELIGKIGPADLSPEIQPDGRPSSEAASDYLSRALAGEFPRFEWMHLTPDGSTSPSASRRRRR